MYICEYKIIQDRLDIGSNNAIVIELQKQIQLISYFFTVYLISNNIYKT